MRSAPAVLAACLVLAACERPKTRPVALPDVQYAVDIGAPDDDRFVGEGFYHREGPSPHSRMTIPKTSTFRWASNEFSLGVPVVPGHHNELTFRMAFGGRMMLRVGDRWKKLLIGAGRRKVEYAVVLPRRVVGTNTRLTIQGTALHPRKPGTRDKRTLFALIDRVTIRPIAALPAERRKERRMAEPDIPTLDRLRGIERRPPAGDPEAFVQQLVEEHANLVTLGTMNGQATVFYPSKLGTPHARMDPDWLPQVTKLLREAGIDILSWVVFNAQDVRKIEDYVPARRFPEWQMQFIEEPGREYPPRVGMCVVSSPYIEWWAQVLKECAGLDIDGFFFDGFYLSGIPHRSRPGCTCEHCQERFRKDTGLELPKQVDWADPTFKRWVRWRNHRLHAVARHFQSEMRKVNPKATCTFNYNIWPFARKDWETAIPAWRIDDFGVSQHGYSGSFAEKWLMPGFKARIGRDINPQHTDMWRACGFQHTCGRGEPDLAWHELEITTFLLTALSHGITPWHSTIAGPIELTARIHDKVAKRERFFSRDHVANVAVLYSQNTHDFYGHIPGTNNLSDYRDALLGTWMALSESHVPFEFVFDNQLDKAVPDGTDVLVLPLAAALSADQCDHIAAWVKAGGHLIATSESSAYDEWGDKLAKWRFKDIFGIDPGSRPVTTAFGKGKVTHVPTDPGLGWCRKRDKALAATLVETIRQTEMPFSVQAPNTLVVNLFRNPKRRNELWVHLLNVSPFMPGGDSGFRGLDQPPAKIENVASDAQLAGTGRRIGGPLVPAKSIVFKLNGHKVRSAKLAVAGQELTVNDDSEVVIPKIELHDVLVLKVK